MFLVAILARCEHAQFFFPREDAFALANSNLVAGTNIFNKLRATLQLSASPVFRCTYFRTHFEVKNDHDFSQNRPSGTFHCLDEVFRLMPRVNAGGF